MPDRRTGFLVVGTALTAAISVTAQDGPPAALRFEAASIRPSAPGGPPISGTLLQGNRLRGTNTSLLALIRSVHFGEGLISDQQSGRYDFDLHFVRDPLAVADGVSLARRFGNSSACGSSASAYRSTCW